MFKLSEDCRYDKTEYIFACRVAGEINVLIKTLIRTHYLVVRFTWFVLISHVTIICKIVSLMSSCLAFSMVKLTNYAKGSYLSKVLLQQSGSYIENNNSE